MRIAPRTMLCANAWRVHENVAGDRFDELRQLCAAAGDKASLAIGMAGLVGITRFRTGSVRRRSWHRSQALIESVGDPTLTVGLSFAPIYAKGESPEWSDALRWSQRVIDLADGDPSKGNFIFGSPLALAFTSRAIARYAGSSRMARRPAARPGHGPQRRPADLRHGRRLGLLRGNTAGVLRPDDRVVREIEDALRIAERSGDDLALTFTRLTLGMALVHRQTDAERDRGQKLLAEVSDVFLRRGHNLGDLPIVDVYVARERARRGDRDEAIPLMRAAADHLFREGQLLAWGVPATGVLVETLLDRGADGDVAEAEAAIDRLADAPADDGLVIRDIWLLRLRALLARAHGDDAAYRDFGIATATWRDRLASKDISPGPRRCHDAGHPVTSLSTPHSPRPTRSAASCADVGRTEGGSARHRVRPDRPSASGVNAPGLERLRFPRPGK